MAPPVCVHCKSMGFDRINPLGKIPLLQCRGCKAFLIPWEDRRKVCIRIGEERPALELFDTAGVINERIFEFWARTDVKGTGAHLLAFLRDQDPEFFRRMTAATTIDRDFRRQMEGNEDGLNKTYRKESDNRKRSGLENFL